MIKNTRSNVFFKKQNLPFMCGEEEIGTFGIDCDLDGEYFYTIELHAEYKNHPMPLILKGAYPGFVTLNDNPDLHKTLVKFWVESRIFPENRENVRWLLDDMGLLEYDQVAVFKHTRLSNRHDDFWLKVESSDTFRGEILPKYGRML